MRRTRSDRADPPLLDGGATLTIPNASFAGLLIRWAKRKGIAAHWDRSGDGYGPIVVRFDRAADRTLALKIAREQIGQLERYPGAGFERLSAAYREVY